MRLEAINAGSEKIYVKIVKAVVILRIQIRLDNSQHMLFDVDVMGSMMILVVRVNAIVVKDAWIMHWNVILSKYQTLNRKSVHSAVKIT